MKQFCKEHKTELWLFFGSFLIFTYLFPIGQSFPNYFTILTDSWLHGRLDTPNLPDQLNEYLCFMGKTYYPFGPGAGLLLLPFTAIFGTGFNAEILGYIIGAANSVIFYHILKNFGWKGNDRLWLTFAIIFGTVHMWLVFANTNWFFIQISGFLYILLGIYFLTRPKKYNVNSETSKKAFFARFSDYFYAGVFFGLAVACRLVLVLGFVFFAGYVLLIEKTDDKKRISKENLCNFLALCIGIAIPAVAYFAYNYARFGTIMDIGYSLTAWAPGTQMPIWYEIQTYPYAEQLAAYKALASSPFTASFANVKDRLYDMFIHGMVYVEEMTPAWVASRYGTAVTFTSPFLVFPIIISFFKKQKKSAENPEPIAFPATLMERNRASTTFKILLAITAIIGISPSWLSPWNGFQQIGSRYVLDVLPYWGLLAICFMKPLEKWHKALIVYSICWFLYGTWLWFFSPVLVQWQ